MTPELTKWIKETHASIFGSSGMGKSAFLQLVAEGIAKNPLQGFTFVCPHGTARALADRFANPAHGCHRRAVHIIDSSSSMVAGLNPFETEDDSWVAAHEASLLWTSSTASLYRTAMIETPRLEKTFYVLGMFAARKRLTLIELLEALSLSAGAQVREFLLAGFDNYAVRRELEDLHFLASRQPARFLELTESARNRLTRWLGDKRLARIFGRQKGLNARRIMDERDIVLVDLSSLAQDDANFLSTLIVCRYFSAAKRRTPNSCAPHHLIIDEAAGSLCTATAQLLDQTRKFGLLGIFSLQRIGQLREKGEFVTDALMVNSGVKIVFGNPEPETARYFAEQLFTGHVDLEEYKPKSVRPTAVGNDKMVLRSSSRAQHHAEHDSIGRADIRAHAQASVFSSAASTTSGFGFASGSSASYLSAADALPLSGPTPLSQSMGRNVSQNSMRTSARVVGRSSSRQMSRAQADSRAHGSMHGASVSDGASESYVTRYADLPTTMYSLEEQLHRLTGEIINLPPRACFLKLPAQQPIRIRTPDLAPAWKSQEFRALMLPLYLDNAMRNSEYLVPADLVDAEIAARLARITQPPEHDHDFTKPEPVPIVSDPDTFARAFWQRRTPQSAGRPPVGNLDDKHERFRVVDGGKPDGDKQP